MADNPVMYFLFLLVYCSSYYNVENITWDSYLSSFLKIGTAPLFILGDAGEASLNKDKLDSRTRTDCDEWIVL